jgi:hypothetical protein
VLSPRCRFIGPKRIYSVFTMRTLYTLFALISLVLVALVATAAPPNPSLTVTCDPNSSTGNCLANTTPTFSGGGLNMHKSYCVMGTSLASGSFCAPLLSVDKQGNYNELSGDSFLNGDTWTFTLWEKDHNGSPSKQLDGPYILTFD